MGSYVVKLLAIIADLITVVSTNLVTIVIVLVVSAVSIGLCYLGKRSFMSRLGTAAEMKHKASHLLRDKHFDLLNLHRQDGIDDDARLKSIAKELENTGKDFVAFVSVMLTELSGEQVNVCIKIIDDPRQPVPVTKDDWNRVFVYTLCRSPKSKHRPRTMPRRVPIAENSDFLRIMRDEGDIFYAPNLRKYDKAQRKMGDPDGYLNSTKSWGDFYNSTVVAPIRIDAERIGVDDVRYDLLGFLCADSMSTRAFPEKYISLYAQLMLSLGDDLYRYLHAVTFMKEKITGKATA